MVVKVKIMSRDKWGAAPPSQPPTPIQTPVLTVVVFPETDTSVCYGSRECIKTMQEIQKSHMDEGQPDIKFNFLVGLDGRVYEGTGWQAQGTSIKNHPELDSKFISIAYIGNFEDWIPPYRMTDVMEKLIKFGKENNYIDQNYRRANINFKSGKLLYDDECQSNRGGEETNKTLPTKYEKKTKSEKGGGTLLKTA